VNHQFSKFNPSKWYSYLVTEVEHTEKRPIETS
jgi:hypothetical protein